MKSITIAEQWANFRDLAIPADVPEMQLVEMEKAFYAGCTSLLAYQKHLAGSDATDEEAISTTQIWQGECDAFLAKELEGYYSENH